MTNQPWWCEACGACGVVPVRSHAGVMEVVHDIAEAHRSDRSGRRCEAGLAHVRVKGELLGQGAKEGT